MVNAQWTIYSRRVSSFFFKVATGEGQKRRPVRAGSVATTMLAESKLAIDKRSLYRRKLCCSQILLAEQLEDGPGSNRSHKTSSLINPFALRSWPFCGAVTDKGGARRAQRNQLVRINRQIIPVERPGVFEKVACHPMVFARACEIFYKFTEIATEQF